VALALPTFIFIAFVTSVIFVISASLIVTPIRAQDGHDPGPLEPPYAYFVDKNNLSGSCSDMNIGNRTEPFCTIRGAVEIWTEFAGNSAADGDIDGDTSGADSTTIYVREGTYHENDILIGPIEIHGMPSDPPGTPGSLLHLRNYPGERVTIDCGGGPFAFLVMSNAIIEGFEIVHFSRHGIAYEPEYISDTQDTQRVGIRIINNTIHTCSLNAYTCSGIYVNNGDNDIIVGNEIYNISSFQDYEGGGIVYFGNNAMIKGNILHNNINNGIRVNGSNNTIRGNVVYNNYESWYGSGIHAEGTNNAVINNTIYNNWQNILLSYCYGCAAARNLIYSINNTESMNLIGRADIGIEIMHSPDSRIMGNTIAFMSDTGIRLYGESFHSDIKNNIIYGGIERAMSLDFYPTISNTYPPMFQSDYNLFHSESGILIFYNGTDYGNYTGQPGYPSQPIGEYVNESGQDNHSLFQVDPLFTDAYGYDFHPITESPVCNMSKMGRHIGALHCGTAASSQDPDPSPTSCTPHWDCTDWYQCVNGTQWRECFDWNRCGLDQSKPNETRQCQVYNDTTLTEPLVNDTEPTDVEGQEPDITVVMPEINETNGTGNQTADIPVVIANITRRHIRINTTRPRRVDIESPNISINTIQINVKRNVTNVSIDVARISDKPPEIVPIPNITDMEYQPYQYLNISHENITDQDIDFVTISFDMNKSWIFENNINKSDVHLARYYIIGQWTKLPTNLVYETRDSVYYEAMSPGLSMFTIMAGTVLSATNRTCVPFDLRCDGNMLQECDNDGMEWVDVQVCEYMCSGTKCVKEGQQAADDAGSWWVITVFVAIVIILGTAAYYYETKRQRLTEEINDMH